MKCLKQILNFWFFRRVKILTFGTYHIPKEKK